MTKQLSTTKFEIPRVVTRIIEIKVQTLKTNIKTDKYYISY